MPLRIPGTDPPVLVLAEQLEHWYNALLTDDDAVGSVLGEEAACRGRLF